MVSEHAPNHTTSSQKKKVNLSWKKALKSFNIPPKKGKLKLYLPIVEQRSKISLHNSRSFKNRHLKQWNQTRNVLLWVVSQTILAWYLPLAEKALIVPHLCFSSTFFFFHFHPNCFPSLSYCSSNVAWTQLPGLPLSEAKDSTPTPCQDTLSVPGSLQTGWSDGEVGVQGGLQRVKATGWDGGKYKKRPDGGGFIGEEMRKQVKRRSELNCMVLFYFPPF